MYRLVAVRPPSDQTCQELQPNRASGHRQVQWRRAPPDAYQYPPATALWRPPDPARPCTFPDIEGGPAHVADRRARDHRCTRSSGRSPRRCSGFVASWSDVLAPANLVAETARADHRYLDSRNLRMPYRSAFLRAPLTPETIAPYSRNGDTPRLE